MLGNPNSELENFEKLRFFFFPTGSWEILILQFGNFRKKLGF